VDKGFSEILLLIAQGLSIPGTVRNALKVLVTGPNSLLKLQRDMLINAVNSHTSLSDTARLLLKGMSQLKRLLRSYKSARLVAWSLFQSANYHDLFFKKPALQLLIQYSVRKSQPPNQDIP
jgi:hypothetical protein